MSNKTDKMKEDFAKRLHEAMDKENYPLRGRARVLSKEFGISDKGAGKWLNGDAIPETSKIPLLANFLNVSSEWLLSGTSNSIDDAKHQDFADRLNKLMKTPDSPITSVNELKEAIGVTYEMARRYTLGTAKPRDEKLKALADIFNIDISYLDHGTGDGQDIAFTVDNSSRSKALEKLIHSLDTLDSNKQLSPELLKALETMVDVATSSANKENK